MLGATSHYKKKDWGFRNYFASSKSGNQIESMRRLESAGLITEGQSRDHMIYFHATIEGCKKIGFTAKQIKKAFEPWILIGADNTTAFIMRLHTL